MMGENRCAAYLYTCQRAAIRLRELAIAHLARLGPWPRLPYIRPGQGEIADRIAGRRKFREKEVNSFPAIGYNEVDGAAGNLRRAGAIERYAIACTSDVAGKADVAGSGRGIILEHF